MGEYKGVYLCLLVSIIALILINDTINVRVSWYGTIPVLWWFNAFAFIILLLCFTQKLFLSSVGKGVRKYIGSLGKNSMIYLCCNQLIILLVMRIPFNDIVGYKVFALFIVLAILGILDMLFHMKYLKKVIGVD